MEYAYAEALCLRSLVSGVPFQKSVSPKQSLNKIEPLFVQGIRFTQKTCVSEALWTELHFQSPVSPEQSLNKKAPIFVHGIRLRRRHVPQKPCKWGTISKVGAIDQTLNKKVPLFVLGIRLRRRHVSQKPCERGVILKTGILEQNTGTLCSRIS